MAQNDGTVVAQNDGIVATQNDGNIDQNDGRSFL